MVQRGLVPRPEDDPIEELDETGVTDKKPETEMEEEIEEMNPVEEEKDPVDMEIDEDHKQPTE